LTSTRIALIGCGHISQFHLRAWQQVPDAEIVGVCDVDGAKAHARANEFGVSAVFTDPNSMLAAVRPDAVDVATRPDTHLALTQLSTRHGAHVLCQKPLAATMEEAHAIGAAASAGGVRLMVNENWRWRTWYRLMRMAIEAGRIGTPLTARVEYLVEGLDVRLERQPYFATMPRLLLYEAAIHFVDCLRFLVGDVQSVYCRLRSVDDRIAGEDVVAMILTHETTTSILETSWSSRGYPNPVTESVRIEGSAATLSLAPDGTLSLLAGRGDAEVIAPPDPDFYLSAFVGAQRHFVDALRSGTPFETRPEDNLQTLDAVFAGYRSAATGEAVRVLARP